MEVLQGEHLGFLVPFANKSVADILQKGQRILSVACSWMILDVFKTSSGKADVVLQPVYAIPCVELVSEAEGQRAHLLHDAVILCRRKVNEGEIRLKHRADFIVYCNLCHSLTLLCSCCRPKM